MHGVLLQGVVASSQIAQASACVLSARAQRASSIDVSRAGHEPAAGEEGVVALEAGDVVDLKADRESARLADAGDPEQALHLGIGHKMRMQRLSSSSTCAYSSSDLPPLLVLRV